MAGEHWRENPEHTLQRRQEEEISRRHSSGHELFDRKVVEQLDAERPELRSFIGDPYDEEEVERDLRELQEAEEGFDPTPLTSKRLEYTFAEGAGMLGWFGPGTETTLPSRFDDVKRGTDVLIHLSRPDGTALVLGVDVTTAEDVKVLQEKVGHTILDLREGNAVELKYFDDGTDQYPKGAKKIPRVVLGTDAVNAERLFERQTRVLDGTLKKEELQRDTMQTTFLKQAEHQLMYMTEHTIDAFLWGVQKKGREQYNEFNEMRVFLMEARSTEVGAEEARDAWEHLLDLIRNQRDVLRERHPELAEHVLMHVDILDETIRIHKEKRAQGIETRKARGRTETFLTLPRREFILPGSL